MTFVQWSSQMAERFPEVSHDGCRQSMRPVPETGLWRPFSPPLCHDWHCPTCGKPVNE
jgi:hypothetical protein